MFNVYLSRCLNVCMTICQPVSQSVRCFASVFSLCVCPLHQSDLIVNKPLLTVYVSVESVCLFVCMLWICEYKSFRQIISRWQLQNILKGVSLWVILFAGWFNGASSIYSSSLSLSVALSVYLSFISFVYVKSSSSSSNIVRQTTTTTTHFVII